MITPIAVSILASYTLRFTQLDREISAQSGESLFQSARRHGVRIVGACGGRGTCGTCVVHVAEGSVERVDAGFDATAEDAFSGKKWVRACQVRPCGDCRIEVAPRSLAVVVRAEIDTGADDERLPLDPTISNHDLVLAEATLADPLSDADRLRQAIGVPVLAFDLAAARRLPGLLHEQSRALRARLRYGEVIDVATSGRHALGLAVDLGTTNVAGFLVDLESGVRLAGLGIENPQAAWGADLISRINYAIGGAVPANELREAALEAINALAHDLCYAIGATRHDIVDVSVCGNTAMHHLLLGLPVRQLGRAPFVAAIREGIDAKARDLGLAVNPGAWIHIAPSIGGFVGGDHVSALLATESRWSEGRTSLVMDIGTNTEISLIHAGILRSVSSPSGPALEGGHISCGMRAAEGAIERVTLAADGALAVRTIGNCEPVGLCGSGVLDALATLHRSGVVDVRGRIAEHHPVVVQHQGKRAVQLAPGVLLTQHDVRAVQLAKAAIRTAVDMLLVEAGLDTWQIDRIIIAGSFGAYIDIESGIEIGLFPDLPRERYDQVGNAAGVGVRMLLISGAARQRARELAASSRYIELSSRSGFQKRFLHNIGFPVPPTSSRTLK